MKSPEFRDEEMWPDTFAYSVCRGSPRQVMSNNHKKSAKKANEQSFSMNCMLVNMCVLHSKSPAVHQQ